MSSHVEGSRNSCALQGALQTVQAVEGFLPIVHSTAGCAWQAHLGVNLLTAGAGTTGPAPSSSNIAEKHVVFGGSSRLREQIKNTVKLLDADLFVVLPGCATEMVGDDVPAMAKEAREQDFPVVFATAPGFRGDLHTGYELVLKHLIEQLPEVAGRASSGEKPMVNLLGVVPQQDVFWLGNLAELRRVLEQAGVTVNLLFGPAEGIAAWRALPDAALNVILSPWGVAAAELLERKYGTPFLDWQLLPVGGEETGRLLTAVAEQLGLNLFLVEEIRKREERQLKYQVTRVADIYFERRFQREFAIVAETAQALGLTEFLGGTLGLIPKTVIVTDNPPQGQRDRIVERLRAALPDQEVSPLFSEDRAEIADLLAESGVELILGSQLEDAAARELGVPLLQVSYPVADRLVLGTGYAGYRGAVSLVEDVSRALLRG